MARDSDPPTSSMQSEPGYRPHKRARTTASSAEDAVEGDAPAERIGDSESEPSASQGPSAGQSQPQAAGALVAPDYPLAQFSLRAWR